jgi:hypothetical protein
MKQNVFSRRSIIKTLVSGAVAVPLINKASAEEPALLNENDTAAKSMHYVSDASRAKGAKPGSRCANCSLYTGDSKSTQAICTLFGNKQVMASGWCEAWTNL